MDLWIGGRRGGRSGFSATFRHLRLVHRYVSLQKSCHRTPLLRTNIPGTDPPDAFTYLRKPASAAPACANLLAICEECGRSPTRQDSFTRNRSAGFR